MKKYYVMLDQQSYKDILVVYTSKPNEELCPVGHCKYSNTHTLSSVKYSRLFRLLFCYIRKVYHHMFLICCVFEKW